MTKQLTNKQCERTDAFGSWWLRQRSHYQSLFTSTYAVIRGAVAGRAVSLRRAVTKAVGRGHWKALVEATSNNRTYAGLLLILVFAPLSGVAYLLLDPMAKDVDWYYRNYFYLFYMLSPHIHMTLTLTGVFLMFPSNRKSYFLVVPVTYHLAKIMWLPMVTTNQELNSWIPGAFWMTALLTAIIWLFMFDYLMELHYHKRTRPVTTMLGAVKCRAISDAKYRELSEKELETLRALN